MYKPCCTLKTIAVFYTCLTGGLRYCQKQNISVCMSPSNWPMKPFIKKTFAPEKRLQWPEMGTPHECWMFFKLLFLHSWLFSKHTFNLIEFANFIALHSFHGQLYRFVEKCFHRELPDLDPVLVLPLSGCLSLGEPLNLFGAPLLDPLRLNPGGCIKWSPVIPLNSCIMTPRDSDRQPVWHF